MRLPAMSVCLSVSKITQKRVHGCGWNYACRQVLGHGRTDQLLSMIQIIVWMPEPENLKVEDLSKSVKQAPHSEQATGHRMYCWEILFTPQWSPRAREFPGYGFSVQRMVVELRGVKVARCLDFGLFKKMILFTASRGNTFVGGTCDLPSALLVTAVFSKDKSRSTSF